MIIKEKKVSNEYLSSLCMELHLIVKAGISIDEGFTLIMDEETDPKSREVLALLHEQLSLGEPLSKAFANAKVFPHYMVSMIEVGEQTGRLEQVFKSLSVYYDDQVMLNNLIRSSVFYPSILFVMMLCVIVVLLVVVLPIFNDVFLSLGTVMSPLAVTMMGIGLWLRSARWAILGILAALIVFALLGRYVPAVNGLFKRIGARFTKNSKLSQKVGSARFASAMAMSTMSGLDVSDALEMSERLCAGTGVGEKVTLCKNAIIGGKPFADALFEAGIFEPLYCRMISVGSKTGSLDTVMEEISRRSNDSVNIGMEKAIGKVEPVLVIIMTALIGLMLLSVMLPLMGVMSSIGG